MTHREEFDYRNGTRWFNRDRVGAPPLVEDGNIARLGSPLETDGMGYAVAGRGPYALGRFEYDYSLFTDYPSQPEDMETLLNLFTGYGTNFMTGYTFDGDGFSEDPEELIGDFDGYDDYYEFRLAAGSPGPTGTGILHFGNGYWPGISIDDDNLLASPMQVCWNQADGVWVEVVTYEDYGFSTFTSAKTVIPLVPSTEDAVTIGVAQRVLRPDEWTEEPVFDFYVNDELIVQSLDLKTGVVLDVPNEPLGAIAPVICMAFVINPVPVEELVPWEPRPEDFINYSEYPGLSNSSPWAWLGNGIWTGEDSTLYYYPGERPRIFEWVRSFYDFTPFRDGTPPLHQSRADYLAAGGAYRYRTARTRQASIWQNAHL